MYSLSLCHGGTAGCNDYRGHTPTANCQEHFANCISTDYFESCDHVYIGGFTDDGDSLPGDPGTNGGSSQGGATTVNNPPNENGETTPLIEIMPIDDVPTAGLQGRPCEELKKMTNNTEIKNKYTANGGLEDQVYAPAEHGFAISRVSNTDTTTDVVNDPDNPAILDMDAYTGGNFIGCGHNHPDPNDGWIPMFPMKDVKFLHTVSQKFDPNGGTKDYSIFVLTVTVASGGNAITYAIKIKDALKFYQFMGADDGEKYEKVRRDLEYKYSQVGPFNQLKLTKTLLNTFKNNDMGVGLYQANEDYSNWKELTINPLDPNDPLKEIDCN